MKHGRDERRGAGSDERGRAGAEFHAGKRTLVELIDPTAHCLPGAGSRSSIEDELGVLGAATPPPRTRDDSGGEPGTAENQALGLGVQRKATGEAAPDGATAMDIASRGVQGSGGPLPYRVPIEALFGRHNVSAVTAHQGPAASEASRQLGAHAYAIGNAVAFGSPPDLHTAAHEAAHVVQQRGDVQLKGGIGEAGDAYERHADAVADRVVAGRSAEDLLDAGAAGGATQAVQRKEIKDDAQILEHQASLKGTDVEIPALEGALLATRKEAVKQGLLSQASYDAGLALSQAMTQLQPAVADKGAVNKDVQSQAAVAAQQMFAALQRETADDKNFQIDPSGTEGTAVSSHNPYTQETRVTTYALPWITSQHTASGLQHLPELIRQGKWEDAFRGYRGLLDGLDLWVADQLRKKGKGPPEEALGNAQQHYSQLRTGLEQIAGKHAKRLPALFHPDAETVEKEKAARRPVADTIPMNVYFWKDKEDGKFHLYDLTTPGRPQEQTLDGEPTAAMMNTFFEEVARYPEGEVRYTLPSGAAGVAPTTGKIKWYEWLGYAGMAVAAVGLAFLTLGASIPATVCFTAGATAGAVSAAGHLVDTERLGTATTATVVLDVAQIVASLASMGALNITVKGTSQYFVALAATADGVSMVALSDTLLTEMGKIQKGGGTPEDQQRAMAVLLTQFIVAGGLTALSVQGVRNVRALKGQPLEVIEQNGVKVLRMMGEDTSVPFGPPAPLPHAESSVKGPGATGAHQPLAHDTSGAPGTKTQAPGGDHGRVPVTSPKASNSELTAATSASAANPAATRVDRPGGHPELLKALDSKAAIDPKYTKDPRFDSLAADPDHAGKLSPNSLQEAMAGLEAESRGLMKGPIERGPPGIEFYDVAGHPWDVKKPPSPTPGANWKFSLRRVAKSIREQLQAKFPNKLTGVPEPVRVLLDSSYMTPADHAALWSQLRLELSPEELERRSV